MPARDCGTVRLKRRSSAGNSKGRVLRRKRCGCRFQIEEPLHVSEELRPTEATGILLAAPRIGDDTMLSRLIDEITQAARGKHTDRARGLIHQLVPEYVPTSGGRGGVAVEPAAKLLPDNGNSGTELATVANIAEFSEHANRQRSAKNQAG